MVGGGGAVVVVVVVRVGCSVAVVFVIVVAVVVVVVCGGGVVVVVVGTAIWEMGGNGCAQLFARSSMQKPARPTCIAVVAAASPRQLPWGPM